MRVWILAVLLAGCSAASPAAPEPGPGQISGWVLDAALRPVPDARVSVEGLGSAVTDEAGFFALRGNLSAQGHLMVVQAEGFRSTSQWVEAVRSDQQVEVRVALMALPAGGYTRLATFSGFIACEAVAQVGHSHGSGGPAEDDRMFCPGGFAEQREFPIETERGATDMLIEVQWEPGTPKAEWMAVAMWADDGELLGFAEGKSILRFELPRLKVQEYFGAMRNATLTAYVGIPEDEPSEVFTGVMVNQDFDVFVTTFYGMDMPNGYTVA